MAMEQFIILTDENIANEVSRQLQAKGVKAERVIDVLPEGISDPDILEFAYKNNYILLTHDEAITKHIKNRIENGQEHAGVFIVPHHLQGSKGIGTIVKVIVKLATNIQEGTETIIDTVYNQIRYIS